MDLEKLPSSSPVNQKRHSKEETSSPSPVLKKASEDFEKSGEMKERRATVKPVDASITYLKVAKGKATVRLALIETLNEIAFTHYPSLSTQHLVILLDCLEGCYQLSLILNNNPLLLSKIARIGM